MGVLWYGKHAIHYSVTYTTRKKTIGIHITGRCCVEVLSPKRISTDSIEKVLLKKMEWILRHSETFQPPRAYGDGERVLYLGEHLPITIGGTRGARIHEEKRGNGEKTLRLPAGAADRKAALVKFYKKEARRIIGERVSRYSAIMDVEPRKVRIKANRSSWGTCTPKNTLNFSYRLIMAPLELVDYVVVHELAHLIHRGHTKAFWSTVSRYVQGVKEKRRWLREKGALLNF